MLSTNGYAAFDAKSPLRPFTFNRRDPGDHDVLIEIQYCGVCHSDLHQVRNEWSSSAYPMVPGHEIVGRVKSVGSKVTKFAPGQIAGIGCMVDSCRKCDSCNQDLEQYCERGSTMTYNGLAKDGKTPTYGGYSNQIVVDERFALRINGTQPLDRVAPLLCAGITTYSPLLHWKVGKDHRVAVLGLGGLGHMAVKIAVALGAEVTLLSSSPSKKADGQRLGAHDFLLTRDQGALATAQGRFDVLIDSVSAPHDLATYLTMVKRDGTMVLLGAPSTPAALPAFPLIMRRRSIAGSLIGGIKQTQEMLDFCAAHHIGADVETIEAQQIDKAYDRMLKSDVRYRFVINTKSLA
jgi:uncharacterized zinc-type alcohol dehydrogenase-like protein